MLKRKQKQKQRRWTNQNWLDEETVYRMKGKQAREKISNEEVEEN